MRSSGSRPWSDAAFGDLVAHSAFGPRFPRTAYAEDGNIATLRTTDLDDYGCISYDRMPLARLNEDQYANHLLSIGDLVITRSGTCGIAAVFEGFSLPVLPGAFLIRFRMAEHADPRFYRYYFNSPVGRRNILSVARGAVQQNLNITNIETLRVPWPPLSEQERTVGLLSAYDNLIENNLRRIALVEDASRQLYREWFVRLRFPGYEHGKGFQGLPDGWSRRPIGVLTSLLSRGITPRYDDEAPGLVINQKCIRDGRLNIALARHQAREFKADRQVHQGDVLINSTGEGTLGRVAQVLAPLECCTVDTHVTIVRPAKGIGHNYFGQALLELEPRLSRMGRGATNQTELSRSQISEIEILVPPCTLVQRFEEHAGPSFRLVATLMQANERLRAARDLLLPRLMSGELTL